MTESAQTNKRPHPFEYHKPTPEQVEVMKGFNDRVKGAYDFMVENTTPNPELTLAMRHLQQARMWFNAGVVLNPVDAPAAPAAPAPAAPEATGS